MSPPELAAQEITGIAEKVRCRALRWVACSGLLAGDDARDRFAGDNGCFSLDGSVCIAGDNRAGLERLLMDCARLPFARDQLELVTQPWHLPPAQAPA